MKRLIAFIIVGILILCFSAKAQKKDSLLPAPKFDTSYAILLKKEEVQILINMIRNQDEKPSMINNQIQWILSKTQFIVPPVTPPQKEQPKK